RRKTHFLARGVATSRIVHAALAGYAACPRPIPTCPILSPSNPAAACAADTIPSHSRNQAAALAHEAAAVGAQDNGACPPAADAETSAGPAHCRAADDAADSRPNRKRPSRVGLVED